VFPPLTCTPSAFEQVTKYVVVLVGDTVILPETALPVSNSVLTHSAACSDDHVIVADSPACIATGVADNKSVGALNGVWIPTNESVVTTTPIKKFAIESKNNIPILYLLK